MCCGWEGSHATGRGARHSLAHRRKSLGVSAFLGFGVSANCCAGVNLHVHTSGFLLVLFVACNSDENTGGSANGPGDSPGEGPGASFEGEAGNNAGDEPMLRILETMVPTLRPRHWPPPAVLDATVAAVVSGSAL